MMNYIKFWHTEWIQAVREGNKSWSIICKAKYREQVLIKLKKEPSMFYVEKFKSYPTIYLN